MKGQSQNQELFYDPLDYGLEINSIDNTRSIFYVAFYIEIDKKLGIYKKKNNKKKQTLLHRKF